MKKNLTPIERFLALSDTEKDAEVAPFEKGTESVGWRPLNAEERKQWAGINRKLGRPKGGGGAKTIAVSMEIGLPKRVDEFAKAHSMKRAEMIAQGLQLMMRAR